MHYLLTAYNGKLDNPYKLYYMFFLCQSLMIRSFIKAGFDNPINSRVIAALSLTKFIPYPSDIKDLLIYYNA